MSIFEEAARRKLRFATPIGTLTVEDLWDLPLKKARGNQPVDLNEVAVTLHSQMQESTVSFVEDAPPAAPMLKLRFDIVKHIIDVRLAEQKAAAEASARAERKQKLLGILALKEDHALEEMSAEQIRELIDDLA